MGAAVICQWMRMSSKWHWYLCSLHQDLPLSTKIEEDYDKLSLSMRSILSKVIALLVKCRGHHTMNMALRFHILLNTPAGHSHLASCWAFQNIFIVALLQCWSHALALHGNEVVIDGIFCVIITRLDFITYSSKGKLLTSSSLRPYTVRTGFTVLLEVKQPPGLFKKLTIQ